MMDSKELRIGNYVSAILPENIVKVTCIDFDSEILGTDKFSDRGFDDFNPIPLTEEWLIKFGFEENPKHEPPHFDKWRQPEDTDFSLDTYNGEYWIVEFLDQSYGSPEIKYVHQLQNLYFALTGQELIYNENHK